MANNKPTRMFLWLCVWLYLVAFVSCHGDHTAVGFSDGQFQVSWEPYTVDGANDDVLWIEFSMSAPVNGVISIWFYTEKHQKDKYDLVEGYTKNISAADKYTKEDAISHVVMVDDDIAFGGKNDIPYWSTKYEGGITTIQFSRKANTGDIYDYNFLEAETREIYIGWSYGNGEVLAEGSRMVNFFGSEEVAEEAQLLRTHGILMVLVVMVLMTGGMVLSRYMKLIFPRWFYAHTALFSTSILLIILSVVVVFKAHGNVFIPGWHSVLGLFFIIGMGLQTLLGILSNVQYDKKRTAPPKFPDKTHWYLGRTVFLLGTITVLLGLYALPATRLAKNSFYAWMVVIFFFILALEKHIGQTHEMPAKGIDQDDEAFMEDYADVYTPKKGNSISRVVIPPQISAELLFKLLCPAVSAILLLFIFVAVGIGNSL